MIIPLVFTVQPEVQQLSPNQLHVSDDIYSHHQADHENIKKKMFTAAWEV